MSMKLGLAVGFIGGYVLGARAGRERYEQIAALWDRAVSTPQVQRAVGATTDLAGQQGRRALSVVQQGVEKAGSAVKERLGRETGTNGWGPGTVESQLP